MHQRKKEFTTLEDLTKTFETLIDGELTSDNKRQDNWPKDYPISRPTYFRIKKGKILTYEKIVSLAKHFNWGTPLIYI